MSPVEAGTERSSRFQMGGGVESNNDFDSCRAVGTPRETGRGRLIPMKLLGLERTVGETAIRFRLILIP